MIFPQLSGKQKIQMPECCFTERASKVRLDLIKVLGMAILQDLKSKGDNAFKDMNDWLGARYLKEMER